jgi:hypothetical protein
LFRRATQRAGDKVRTAAGGAAQVAAQEILSEGQADIQGAPGNWGSRWPAGLKAEVTEGGGNIRISVSHMIPYFKIFEEGGTISGKPLLWIPLIFAPDAIGKSAGDLPQPLFRVYRKSGGAPLLLSTEDKQPKYVGKEEVTIPQKFHIRDIARDVAKRMKDFYKQNVK